jgi:signal transduction histidine kinase
MIDSVRVRLALWHVLVLAILQVVFCFTVYVLLSQSIYRSVDRILTKVTDDVKVALQDQINRTSDVAVAPVKALDSLYHTGGVFAIYDKQGHLLAEKPPGSAARLAPFPTDPAVISEDIHLYTWTKEKSNRHRMSVQFVSFPGHGAAYVIVTSHMLDPMLSDVRLVQKIFIVAVPILLVLAGLCGWLLARKSLAPVVAMSDRARRIGEDNDKERLIVYNPRDELGRLAIAFNELLNRLSNALSLQRQFMADAGHELRTPISIMRTATEIALDQKHREESEYRAALSVAAAQTRHLSRTVEDVFRLARSDMGRNILAVSNIYLDEVLEEAGRNAALLGKAKDIVVEMSDMPESPFKGDEELLRQMVSNLLENSLKFTPNGGRIGLSLERTNEQYVITVVDSGIGVPVDARGRIFDRFFRGESSSVHGTGAVLTGSGLGLSIARGIAEAHHGTLNLLASDDHGTTFVACLPLT